MPSADPVIARWYADEVQPHEGALRAWLAGRFPHLAPNLYLELAGARARHPRNLDQNHLTYVTIDPNPRLSDGSPNPG